MSHALEIIGAFVFGTMIGGGIVGGMLGWLRGNDKAMACFVVSYLTQQSVGDPDEAERVIMKIRRRLWES